jgi:hypothetical protein
MRDRAEKYLRIACWLLAALLVLQLIRAMVRNHPFARVTIPAVPTLSPATNATPAAAPAGPVPAMGDTNQPHISTNPPGANLGTNPPATNQVASHSVTNLGANPPAELATNSPALTSLPVATNVPGRAHLEDEKLTNAPTHPPGSTNLAEPTTNSPAGTNAAKPGANALAAAVPTSPHPPDAPPMPGRPGRPGMGMGMGGGPPQPELPPVERARIDRIVASELLGPVFHPQPMALLGIAGDVAFLRSAGGQTGLVKEGDSLGDLKLIRIGINRVLIEQNGQKQELTIFSGMGGESLLESETNKNPHETTNH